MTRSHIASRVLILALLMAAALVSASCDSGGGMGVGMSYPARWGGTSGPPVLVGGPVYR
jgi:hypothetical protein